MVSVFLWVSLENPPSLQKAHLLFLLASRGVQWSPPNSQPRHLDTPFWDLDPDVLGQAKSLKRKQNMSGVSLVFGGDPKWRFSVSPVKTVKQQVYSQNRHPY